MLYVCIHPLKSLVNIKYYISGLTFDIIPTLYLSEFVYNKHVRQKTFTKKPKYFKIRLCYFYIMKYYAGIKCVS